MRIWVDTADVDEIARWAADDRISGFTTNPTLMRAGAWDDKFRWMAQPGMVLTPEIVWDYTIRLVAAAAGKPISIDGPIEVWDLGQNVYRKRTGFYNADWTGRYKVNTTAICSVTQIRRLKDVAPDDIISVFAGRIMDTGRDPQPVIDAAKQTGAQVLWASVREPYNIVQAEQAGCDIITVPPAILRKWFDWQGLPLETVAARTIAQFDKDREGLW